MPGHASGRSAAPSPMSKERARRRVERQALVEQRVAENRQRVAAEADRRRRRARWRVLLGRRPDGSSRAPLSARRKERRAVIASALLVVAVLTYLMSRSVAMVVGVLLVAAIAVPALAVAFGDRSRR
jgi:Flp pilus assembly protein TadB